MTVVGSDGPYPFPAVLDLGKVEQAPETGSGPTDPESFYFLLFGVSMDLGKIFTFLIRFLRLDPRINTRK